MINKLIFISFILGIFLFGCVSPSEKTKFCNSLEMRSLNIGDSGIKCIDEFGEINTFLISGYKDFCITECMKHTFNDTGFCIEDCK